MNDAAVLGFGSIGKGHLGAKKEASVLIMNKLIKAHCWKCHKNAISEYRMKSSGHEFKITST